MRAFLTTGRVTSEDARMRRHSLRANGSRSFGGRADKTKRSKPPVGESLESVHHPVDGQLRRSTPGQALRVRLALAAEIVEFATLRAVPSCFPRL
jgi:hypothetical protein